MKIWKRCAAVLLAAALCAALAAGCAEEAEGVSLAVCVGAEPQSLDPIYAAAEGDQTILNHLYENLMRVTVDVSGGTAVTNGMAKSYRREDRHDGTVAWTFKLRGAKWSDGAGRKGRGLCLCLAAAGGSAQRLTVCPDAVRGGGV